MGYDSWEIFLNHENNDKTQMSLLCFQIINKNRAMSKM